MKQIQYFILITLFFSLAATGSVYGIKCYSCESVYEPNCAADFDAESYFKLDCSFIAPPRFLDNDLINRNATACMKIAFKEHGVQKYVRNCFFGDVNETEVGCRMDPALIAVQNVSCHVCNDENFCNGAIHIQFKKWNLTTTIGFILVAKMFQLV